MIIIVKKNVIAPEILEEVLGFAAKYNDTHVEFDSRDSYRRFIALSVGVKALTPQGSEQDGIERPVARRKGCSSCSRNKS